MERPFAVDRAKTGRSGCKVCKQKIESGTLRIARIQSNPFGGDGSTMKAWHHVPCLFTALSKARATTRRIENPEEDIEGWDQISQEDKDEIQAQLEDMPAPKTPKTKAPAAKAKEKESPSKNLSQVAKAGSSQEQQQTSGKDDSFREFRRICSLVAEVPAYTDKSNIVHNFLTKGSSGDGFTGDKLLWVRLLLPMVEKRIYNLQSKQLIKLFSQIFGANHDAMLEDLEQGDVANTIKTFYEASSKCPPVGKSTLSLQEVDGLLDELSNIRTEDKQILILQKIVRRCTSNDLLMIVRLIVHDLRINAGPKHILDGVHKDAYEAFQNSRDLRTVINQSTAASAPLKIGFSLMTPCLPMLAEVCKSVEQAMTRCPNGMLAEVKYDGERVQVHKSGDSFRYFSRSLKPVQEHKIKHFAKHIPKAFPHGHNLVLDSEVLLMDTTTGKPLPFGTLGVHKKAEFEDASVCLFVFDCLFYNGKSLLNKSIQERREILTEVMTEVPHHVVFSETKLIHQPLELEKMIARVLSEGLEGLVLKDLQSKYEPGKRHWLKIKKDYLAGGKMADTADLVPLGSWFGTGSKGGMQSIFLMCSFDPVKKVWVTVTKVHGGFDNKELEKLQTSLEMRKISKQFEKIPSWLHCHRHHAPDFIAVDPEKMPVWEITGAEFTSHDAHTAGISVRFPRVTRVRDDKTFKEATNLQELMTLYQNSRNGTDVSSLFGDKNGESSKKTDLEKLSPVAKRRKIEQFFGSPVKKEPETVKAGKKAERDATSKESHIPHSPKRIISNPCKDPNLICPLPDVFTGVRLVFPSWVQHRELARYFIAFGGEILTPLQASKATHCIYDSAHPPLTKGSVIPVRSQWIINSIRTKKLQPVS
ncbi:DNA ligase 3 [Neocloeon triangulifer]|uniref:DNA ligase 3 n=1 Tax=Neocloeon triangulifer TaxID=2078957 RepID=UPI00286ECEF6|nr:DNA ligase 3 [Neocloeon triangulifer]XP_059472594.1 DNA ligase 3 [Neocloeon triangulifer]